jgi:class 3 adenylate cyclase
MFDDVRVRIGLHVGTVIREAGDFFGRTVILAARVASTAAAGEILVSEAVREALEPLGFVFDAPCA